MSRNTERQARAIEGRNKAYQDYKKAYSAYKARPSQDTLKKAKAAQEKYKYWCETLDKLKGKQPQEDTRWERSDNYRREFLKKNPGILGHHYMCIYCFKLIRADQMQVDHLVAVNRVKKNKLWRLLPVFWTNKGVNTTMNLYPACKKCNREKSDKGGSWILRGAIGASIWMCLQKINEGIAKLLKSKVFYICLLGLAGFLVLNYGLGAATFGAFGTMALQMIGGLCAIICIGLLGFLSLKGISGGVSLWITKIKKAWHKVIHSKKFYVGLGICSALCFIGFMIAGSPLRLGAALGLQKLMSIIRGG